MLSNRTMHKAQASVIPVVVFAHRRPDTLTEVLSCLRRDGVPLIYVFVDGPARAEHVDDVAAVRQLAHSVDWCDCRVECSEDNLGLGRSVKRGVTAVLEAHEAAIFVEDDLITVPGTYAYLCSALNRYEHETAVMSVTGWTHPRVVPSDVAPQPYFDGKAECWVWGTWRRSWVGMDRPAMDIMAACTQAGIDVERYGQDMPKMARQAATRNLWAIGWWYHHLLHGGLCLRPPWSMVEQICWDAERSTTTEPDMKDWMNPPLRPSPPQPLSWPEPVEHPDCERLWRAAVGG